MQAIKPEFMVSPPLFQVLKIIFDRDSRGNPGPTSFGGVCRDSTRRIISSYVGAIRADTNNSVEPEGLIWGFECLIREGWIPMIIEGDNNIVIQIVRRFANGWINEKIYDFS